MPSDPLAQVEAIIRSLKEQVETQLGSWLESTTPSKFKQMEMDVHALLRGVADQLSGLVLVALSQDPTFQAETAAAAHVGSAGTLRGAGHRTVKVRLLGGSVVSVKVAYLAQRRHKRQRRTRRRRRRTCRGLYPLLAALGIWFGVTPALAGEVCRQVADSDSVRTGREALDRRGIDLGHKQTLRIVNRFGSRAVQQRQDWLLDAIDREPSCGVLRGKRVVVETDGGRLRERVKRGRRSKRTGHHRYDAPWREPKLLTIYVIDDKGDVEQSFRPILDGTLDDCNAIFAMLAGYLRALGAHEAKELIFIADGAKWIWDRTGQLAEMVGLPMARVTETVDWYHAVETLHEVADLRSRWPKKSRAQWLKRAKKALFAGAIDDVMRLFDDIAVGRKARGINKHRDYFRRNRNRMQYAAFKAAQRPLGSGAVESGVRRVINMRMKANGTFWLCENAEGMLLLRGYLKAGRFDDLVDWSIASSASWWNRRLNTAPIAEHVRLPS